MTAATSHHHAHDDSRIDEPGRRVVRAAVTEQPLDEVEHRALVTDEVAGAVVTFAGVVRNHDHGAAVLRLEYLAHPSAQQVVEQVAAQVAQSFPVDAVAVSHRTGPLAIGEAALVVAVAAAHRREAFEAASEMVEQVKHQLPIWKHQFLADGSDEWVNCP